MNVTAYLTPKPLNAFIWTGGDKIAELPPWMANCTQHFHEKNNTLTIGTRTHQTTAAAGDVFVQQPDGKLEAVSHAAFEQHYEVREPEAQSEDEWNKQQQRRAEMKVGYIARVCHQVNRAYCVAQGDMSQQRWEQAPKWQRESAIEGVKYRLQSLTAPISDLHDNWSKDKLAAGWKFGPTKDENAKTHPCLVPFDMLPLEQRAKDYLFASVVDALA